MKKILAVALCFATPVAFAGTCAAPGAPITQGGTHIDGTTCGADATFGGGICSGSQFFDPTTPVGIYQIEVGATNDFNLVVTDTAPYNAAIALIGPGSCGPVAPCFASGNDANAAGGGETLPDGGVHFAPNIAAGTYYAAVFSFDSGPAGCGAFGMDVGPTLPVQLQSFTVG
jgi:hypothetical protein